MKSIAVPGLLRLPFELRDQIYAEVFAQPSDSRYQAPERTSLLQICRQIHAEARSALLTATRFLRMPFARSSDPKAFHEYIRYRQAKSKSLIGMLPNLQVIEVWRYYDIQCLHCKEFLEILHENMILDISNGTGLDPDLIHYAQDRMGRSAYVIAARPQSWFKALKQSRQVLEEFHRMWHQALSVSKESL